MGSKSKEWDQLWDPLYRRLYLDFSARHLSRLPAKHRPASAKLYLRHQRRPVSAEDRLPSELGGKDGDQLARIEDRLWEEWTDRALAATKQIIDGELPTLRPAQRRHIADVVWSGHRTLPVVVYEARRRFRMDAALRDLERSLPTPAALCSLADLLETLVQLPAHDVRRRDLAKHGFSSADTQRFVSDLQNAAQLLPVWVNRFACYKQQRVERTWERLWDDPSGQSVDVLGSVCERTYPLLAADRQLMTDGVIRSSSDYQQAVRRYQKQGQRLKDAEASALRWTRRHRPPLKKPIGELTAKILNLAYANWRLRYDSAVVLQKIRDRR